MKKINSRELKEMWLEFFKSKGHTQIASAPLVPQNDNSVLFTIAGMHPLIPYLLGEPHPAGKRLCNYQKCIRTNDIDSAGDASHLTCFEMLGNWSLGDFYKKEMIEYSFEFLTSDKYLAIPIDRLAVTVFAGNDDAPKDEEAYNTWLRLGIKKENIFYLKDNWWQASDVGPCGTDSEMFYITDKEPCGPDCNPSCDCGRYLEIWNDVFMGYEHTKDHKLVPLEKKNIDTGMGLERVISVLNGYKSVYECDIYRPVIDIISKLSGKNYESDESTTRAFRIIADHMRSATMILGDEYPTTPSNLGRGYVLRRLIRRCVNLSRTLGFDAMGLTEIANYYIDSYKEYYPTLDTNHEFIINELVREIKKFNNTIGQGLKEFRKVIDNTNSTTLAGDVAFRLYETFGFPIELTCELANAEGMSVDMDGFHKCLEEHRAKSRANTQVFTSGLSGTGEMETKYHTATHILHAALRKKYGEGLHQRGSNNTPERLRFDFNLDHKMTDEEIKDIENEVNRVISMHLPVTVETMSPDEAKKSGAIGLFDNKYGASVTVYSVGDYSKEICRGPHVKNTSELGVFEITKEESCGSGVRRIKAILKDK